MKAIARNVGEGELFNEGDEVIIKEMYSDGKGFIAYSPFYHGMMYCLVEKCSHLRGGYWEIVEEEEV